MPDNDERYVRNATLIMLALGIFASAISTLVHWFRPIYQPWGLIVPPVICLLFTGLLVALILRPRWVMGIARTALMLAWLALAAASWGYTLQAILIPGLHLVRTLPPVTALLPVIMGLVILFFPGRRAFRVALLGWVIIALPVLGYLFLHPSQMWLPRGEDLLMAYGPWTAMVVVLLPMQRGLTGRIRRLVSEQARMEDSINRDPLTNIFNRRLAGQVLQDILVEQSPAGVIMFDMDEFKTINDTHGHPVGDHVLQTVAAHCKKLLRRYEIISRWGGEEFLVVVPNISADELLGMAERLRMAIAGLSVEPVEQVTASFGIALIKEQDSLATLLQRVDRNLYLAKQRGGNCVMCTSMMPEDAPESGTPGMPGEKMASAS